MITEELISEAINIVKKAGAYIREELGKVKDEQIEEKELNSLVSYVDKTAEEMIVPVLSAILPGAGFITEEGTVEASASAYQWIIDPLDGTNNFLHQIPHFAVSVALSHESDIELGIVYNIMLDECFHAVKGKGAFLDHKPIRVSKVNKLESALLATGFPYANDLNTQPLIDCLSYWIKNTRGVRRLGAAALDLCFVACGRLDAYYEAHINIWDIAAGVLIVQEAGGTVTDMNGGNNHLQLGEVISSNKNVYNDIKQVIDTCFQNATNPT